MGAQEIEVDTILFDMDGTLIDSTPALNATWIEFAREYDLDADYVLHNSFGHRTTENLARYIPALTGDALAKEVVRFETRILEIAEANRRKNAGTGSTEGMIVAMPGARALLNEVRTRSASACALTLRQLNAGRAENPERRAGWAIVTSAKAFAAADVAAPPQAFVTGDDCARGKPDPEPYLTGATRAHAQNVAQCLVVEDAPPGVASGKAAGARVLGLCTTSDGGRMWANGADFLVQDLRDVHAHWAGDRLLLTMDSAERPADASAAR
ncbi:hypothetical protein MSPP1_003872 [Malassezia sp. CBS 17886]|nr:hypothetical protein MSPP1_003872 [Malassezia sp. CBS 17886]